MAEKEPISSINNVQIKHILSLQTKVKYRNKHNIFIVEGEKLFIEACEEKAIKKVYISETFSKTRKDINYKEYNYELVKDNIFKKISDTVNPQGILAITRKQGYELDQIITNDPYNKKTIIILEDIRDPGNLGTIIRTAEGAGISALIINKTSVDLYNPKVIRSTMGSIFRLPIIISNDLEETINKLKESKVHIFATKLDAKDYYREINSHKNVAIIIGNESKGVSNRLSNLANSYIKIPMSGKVESLNAAIAAALIMYERKRT